MDIADFLQLSSGSTKPATLLDMSLDILFWLMYCTFHYVLSLIWNAVRKTLGDVSTLARDDNFIIVEGYRMSLAYCASPNVLLQISITLIISHAV